MTFLQVADHKLWMLTLSNAFNCIIWLYSLGMGKNLEVLSREMAAVKGSDVRLEYMKCHLLLDVFSHGNNKDV